MRPLKLHTKTALLVSAITMAVLAATLWIVSVRVVDLVREEETALAGQRASGLAEHISNMRSPRDPDELARAATLVRNSRPKIATVRIWERSGGVFVERAAAAGSLPVEEIPEDTRAALRSGVASQVVSRLPLGAESFYRVFAPVKDGARVSGAVEVVERLDSVPSIALRYAGQAAWMALVAVALITIATYLLFRLLVYRPIERLLDAMAHATTGSLEAKVEVRARDELGRLTVGFNRMLERIGVMTKERELQQEVLRERVREATVELQHRNEQLEQTNLELWQTTRRLAQLERLAAAGQTAAQFAHEVGTPLNLISCHVELLRADLATDPRTAGIRMELISDQIERIERIVRNILDRTRIAAPELEPLDLRTLVERVCRATAPTLDARGVKVSTDLAADLPLIAGESDHLQQVLINLFNNALDAMPDGGELRIRAFLQRNRVVLEVADTGCGMSPETRARIFDPLYTTKQRGRGTGLGLAVVSQFIEEHHGTIEVDSEPGRGALFRLGFPVAGSSESVDTREETYEADPSGR